MRRTKINLIVYFYLNWLSESERVGTDVCIVLVDGLRAINCSDCRFMQTVCYRIFDVATEKNSKKNQQQQMLNLLINFFKLSSNGFIRLYAKAFEYGDFLYGFAIKSNINFSLLENLGQMPVNFKRFLSVNYLFKVVFFWVSAIKLKCLCEKSCTET